MSKRPKRRRFKPEETVVWLAGYSSCDGGSHDHIFKDRESAIAWLRREHHREMLEAARMDEFVKRNAEEHILTALTDAERAEWTEYAKTQQWECPTPIEDRGGESGASFGTALKRVYVIPERVKTFQWPHP